MQPQRSHKSPEGYSSNKHAAYLRHYRANIETPEQKAQRLAIHYARKKERMASDPEYRAKHAERNNARLKERRSKPETWVRIALNQMRSRAISKGIPFNIEPHELTAPTHCPVLGIKLAYGSRATDGVGACPSFDKLRPELGYVRGNVRVISFRANTIKNDATKAEVAAVLAYMEREGL